MKKFIALFVGALFILGACEDSDDVIQPSPEPNQSVDVEVQNFFWRALNLWYFWQGEVPDLADTRFTTNEEYTNFLASNTNPETFFYETLLFSEDRFSWIVPDYKDLVNSLSGITKNNGMEYGLFLMEDQFSVYGYVRYILPNSDASTKDIIRGEIFTGINGQSLNLDNYQELLGQDSYTLNMASIEGNVITNNGKEVFLVKEEGFQENPILIANTLDINGAKIGYLMFNGFRSAYDEELNQAFGTFKADGVTDLVLDMRYNGGGSVNTSRLLASMIYGTNTDELYIRQRWNDKIQSQLSASFLEDYFANSTGTTPINSLNLNRVYVLATNSSASASELVMNGLDPYIEVIHIGSTTRGKNEFSITLVDDEEGDYVYNEDRTNLINPNVQWGMQPLVGRNENSVGFLDYTNGFAPDHDLPEDLENLGVLGDPSEPLLAKAIELITGVTAKTSSFKAKMPIRTFSSSLMFKPTKDNMYLDKKLELNK